MRSNLNTLELPNGFLLGEVTRMRVNERFIDQKYQTTFLESAKVKLKCIFNLGVKLSGSVFMNKKFGKP